jgi:glc operon protein GlcG
MKTKKYLALDDAKIIAAGCEKEALSGGKAVTVAIVDDGGHLLILQRLDDAPLLSMEIAIGKARTAAIARRPSKFYMDRINNNEVAVLSLPGNLTCMEGGEPIMIDGECIGAVGVSGVTGAEDAVIARAGISALIG